MDEYLQCFFCTAAILGCALLCSSCETLSELYATRIECDWQASGRKMKVKVLPVRDQTTVSSLAVRSRQRIPGTLDS